MTRGPRVVVAGDVIDDIIVRPNGPIRVDTDTDSVIERRLGGSAANTACWLAAEGVDVTFVGTVHHDDLARHTSAFEAAGVTPRLTASDLPTGSIVLIVDGAVRTMLTSRGANAATGPELLTDEVLDGARHLHLTGYSFFGSNQDAEWRRVLERATALGLTRSVDPSSTAFLERFGVARFRELVSGVEVLLPSLDEARLLAATDNAEIALQNVGAQFPVVVVTRGASGAIALEHGTRRWEAPAVATAAIDVTGAGDAFNAGFLAAALAGSAVPRALARGVQVAARAVETVGARPVAGR